MKREKSPIREKFNMERVQHEESATRKMCHTKRECETKKVQYENSATCKKRNIKKATRK